MMAAAAQRAMMMPLSARGDERGDTHFVCAAHVVTLLPVLASSSG
jgi:hypothetical protein